MPRSALFCVLVFLIISLIAAVSAEDQLLYERTHLVDVFEGTGFTNYLFRSNIPIDQGNAFAKDLLPQFMKTRAATHGITLPDNIFIVDISLMNDFDQNMIEAAFFNDTANVDYGRYIYWPMGLAGLYDPREYTVQQQMTMSNTTVWDFDKLPTRMLELRAMLQTPGPVDKITKKIRPQAFLLHCQAGRDRTGQAVIGYRIASTALSKFTPTTLKEYFTLNVEEGGRCPNDWSVKATEWYCLYYKFQFGTNMGDCLNIANCKRFGNCTPIV